MVSGSLASSGILAVLLGLCLAALHVLATFMVFEHDPLLSVPALVLGGVALFYVGRRLGWNRWQTVLAICTFLVGVQSVGRFFFAREGRLSIAVTWRPTETVRNGHRGVALTAIDDPTHEEVYYSNTLLSHLEARRPESIQVVYTTGLDLGCLRYAGVRSIDGVPLENLTLAGTFEVHGSWSSWEPSWCRWRTAIATPYIGH
jgi:hypothetical protein